jgi:hypothetical protein
MLYYITQDKNDTYEEKYWGSIKHDGTFKEACAIFFNYKANSSYNVSNNTLDSRLLLNKGVKK